MIGEFSKNKLIISDENYIFQEDVNRITLNDEVKKEIASNEATAYTCALVKEGSMEGTCKMEDLHECASTSNIMWSKNWKKNKALVTEAFTVLDLFDSVAKSMK